MTRWPSWNPGYCGTELLDNTHRLVADDEAAPDRVFAFPDVNIGATDGRRGHPQQGVQRSDLGHRPLVQHNAPRLDKHRGLHLVTAGSLAPFTSMQFALDDVGCAFHRVLLRGLAIILHALLLPV
jgi:hypothetical protein